MDRSTMTTSDETQGGVGDAGYSTGLGLELDLPGLPAVEGRRSTITMLATTVGFALMALYGDTFVAGRVGSAIALLGLFGIVVVTPTLLSRGLRPGPRSSRFRPD